MATSAVSEPRHSLSVSRISPLDPRVPDFGAEELGGHVLEEMGLVQDQDRIGSDHLE